MKRKAHDRFTPEDKDKNYNEEEQNDTSRDISFEIETIKDILIHNGETDVVIAQGENLAQKCDIEVDPPIIFAWYLDAMLNVITNPGFFTAAVQPFHVALPASQITLRTAIITYVKGNYVMPSLGSSIIPCCTVQAMNIISVAAELCQDPWIISVNNFSPIGPIAEIYIPRARSFTVERVLGNRVPPNGVSLWL